MKQFNFEDKSNVEILEYQKVINILLIQNYTIDKIAGFINVSRFNIDKILKYRFEVPPMVFEPRSYFSEQDLIVGKNDYCYENLSPSEQAIFNNLKHKL